MIIMKTSGDGNPFPRGTCAHCKRDVDVCNFTCEGALAYKAKRI